MAAVEPLQVVRGHLLDSTLDVEAAQKALPVSASGIVPFTVARLGPRYITFVPAPAATSGQEVRSTAFMTTTAGKPSVEPRPWIRASDVRGAPVEVALRVTAALVQSLLTLRAGGTYHGFVDSSAVWIRQRALDAALRPTMAGTTISSGGATSSSSSKKGVKAAVDEDDGLPDVLVGNYPLRAGMFSPRALTHQLADRFSMLAPELRSVVTGTKAIDGEEDGSLVGPSADVWAVGAVLLNLLSRAPLATDALATCRASAPWLVDYPPAVVSLLQSCLSPAASKRPTLVAVAMHPVFGTTRVTAAANAPVTAQLLIEQLRKRKKIIDEAPDDSPLKWGPATRSDAVTGDNDEAESEDDATEEEEEPSEEDDADEDEDDSDSDEG